MNYTYRSRLWVIKSISIIVSTLLLPVLAHSQVSINTITGEIYGINKLGIMVPATPVKSVNGQAGVIMLKATDLSTKGRRDSTTFLRGDNTWAVPTSNLTTTAPQDVTYTNPATGATGRPLNERLGEELWVEDFRAPGDSDADVWQKAITAMQTQRQPLYAGRREYYFNRTIIVGGDYWHVIGNGTSDKGTVIKGTIAGFEKIAAPTAADLSYPTTTDPGPMKGCAFYFTSLIYYSRTENLSFFDFRFGMAFLQAHNSAAFINCTFGYGNVGVICYQGSQNFQYNACQSYGPMNVIHVSSATCFPAGTPYASQDNYYTDGLTIKNEGGYGSFGCSINADFDNWFVASFLRPDVVSVSAGGSTTYQDRNGNTYAANSTYCTPSGRVVFVPMRNPRYIFGTQFRDIDVRGATPRGFCLLNYAVTGMIISGQLAFEGMFDNNTDSTGYFTIGAAHNGLVNAPYSNLGYIEVTHPLLRFSGRGFSSGYAEAENRLTILGNNGTNSFVSADNPRFTGRVGIGNAAPTATLDVSGTAHITGALALDTPLAGSALAAATTTTRGAVRPGSGLAVDAAGVLSVTASGGGSAPVELDPDAVINGYGAYTIGLIDATTSGPAFSSAKVYAVQFVARQTKTYTSLNFAVTTAATLLKLTDATTNGVAVYDLSGNRLALFDAQTAYTTTGSKSLTTTGFTLTAGRAYVLAFVSNGSGTPLALRCSPTIANINDGLGAGPYRWSCKSVSALTTPLDFKSFTALSSQGMPWAGLR